MLGLLARMLITRHSATPILKRLRYSADALVDSLLEMKVRKYGTYLSVSSTVRPIWHFAPDQRGARGIPHHLQLPLRPDYTLLSRDRTQVRSSFLQQDGCSWQPKCSCSLLCQPRAPT